MITAKLVYKFAVVYGTIGLLYALICLFFSYYQKQIPLSKYGILTMYYKNADTIIIAAQNTVYLIRILVCIFKNNYVEDKN
jgi:hypothetical protein